MFMFFLLFSELVFVPGGRGLFVVMAGG